MHSETGDSAPECQGSMTELGHSRYLNAAVSADPARYCGSEPAPHHQLIIRELEAVSRGEQPGYCENTPPMKAQRTEQRVESLQTHLDNTRVQYQRDPEGQWLITAKGLLGHIRDAWESAVEGAVAPVLRTFSSKIDTRGFSKLSAITLEDADAMRAAYGRCSALLHQASDALNPSIPTPDQIAGEIGALRGWIDNLRRRQDQINAA